MAKKTFRVPVAFGKAGNGKRARKKTVVLVLERTRSRLGLQQAKESELKSDKKSKHGEYRRLRGDKDNSIKIWTGGKTKKGYKKYVSVPYPAGATISQISKFVKKIKGAKTFTMPTGQTYSVGQ
jgi:hypothetical protein